MPAFCNARLDDDVALVHLIDLRIMQINGLEVIFGVVMSPYSQMYHVIHYESGQKTRVVSLSEPHLALHKFLDDEIRHQGAAAVRASIEHLTENEWSVLNEIDF